MDDMPLKNGNTLTTSTRLPESRMNTTLEALRQAAPERAETCDMNILDVPLSTRLASLQDTLVNKDTNITANHWSSLSAHSNDILPSELLERIFREYLSDDTPNLSLQLLRIQTVCRTWYLIASRLELLFLQLRTEAQVDRLLDHVRDVHNRHERRAGPIQVSITTRPDKGPHRFGELMTIMRSSVTHLEIGCAYILGGVGPITAAIQSLPIDKNHFINLRVLSFGAMMRGDLSAVLLACDSNKLKSLTLAFGTWDIALLRGLCLPQLNYFEIESAGYKIPMGGDCSIEKNWSFFLAASPALKCLSVTIYRQRLDWLVALLRDETPKSLTEVKIGVKAELRNQKLNFDDPIFKELLDLIEARQWKKQVYTDLDTPAPLWLSKYNDWL